jgi:GT2 family glycosyltransferase
LRNCIKSIHKFSDLTAIEIIIVDNASKDGSEILPNELMHNATLIKNTKNLGFGAANNIGLKKASGDYALLLNNDTIFIEDTISQCLNLSDNIDSNFILGCQLINTDKSIQPSIYKFPTLSLTFSFSFYLYLFFPRSKMLGKGHTSYKNKNDLDEVDVVMGSFMFLPKITLEKLNGFDEDFFFYYEEFDLCKRLHNIGGKCFFTNTTSIIHLGGASAKNDSWFSISNRYKSLFLYLQKHSNEFEYSVHILLYHLGFLLRVIVFVIAGIFTFKKMFFRKSYYFLKLFFTKLR